MFSRSLSERVSNKKIKKLVIVQLLVKLTFDFNFYQKKVYDFFKAVEHRSVFICKQIYFNM